MESPLPWKLKCAEEHVGFCKGDFNSVYSGYADRVIFGRGTKLLIKPSRYLFTNKVRKDRIL